MFILYRAPQAIFGHLDRIACDPIPLVKPKFGFEGGGDSGHGIELIYSDLRSPNHDVCNH